MKKEYLSPLTEVVGLASFDSLMLPASPNGHTDESLSRRMPRRERVRDRLDYEWEDEYEDEELGY